MGVKPQKDPRYKLIAERGGRRYRDMLTGDLLTRRQFEERTRAGGQDTQSRAAPQPTPFPGMPGGTWAPDPPAGTGDYGAGPVPMADLPEPPPGAMAAEAMQAGERVAELAAARTADLLANQIGDGVAMCVNLIADVRMPPERRYLVIETPALAKVTRPEAPLIARRVAG